MPAAADVSDAPSVLPQNGGVSHAQHAAESMQQLAAALLAEQPQASAAVAPPGPDIPAVQDPGLSGTTDLQQSGSAALLPVTVKSDDEARAAQGSDSVDALQPLQAQLAAQAGLSESTHSPAASIPASGIAPPDGSLQSDVEMPQAVPELTAAAPSADTQPVAATANLSQGPEVAPAEGVPVASATVHGSSQPALLAEQLPGAQEATTVQTGANTVEVQPHSEPALQASAPMTALLLDDADMLTGPPQQQVPSELVYMFAFQKQQHLLANYLNDCLMPAC